MKVALDISQVAHSGGVATYTKELAENLQEAKGVELKLLYMSLRKPYRGALKNVKEFRFPPSLFEKVFNGLRLFSIETLVGPIDVYHSSDWIQAPSKAKKVTTYHDVIPLKYPEWSHPEIVKVHKRRLEIVEKEIDIVIAVSETTKKDLLEVSNLPEEKIVVIYEGVDKRFTPQPKDKVESFRREKNLPASFILAIGGVGVRRNLNVVKKAAQGYELVITGESIKGITDDEMPLLYCAADLLLYPSLYEGFGLPIIEAMACGTPVITSNLSSMKEVAGEAALLVDPHDEEDVRKKLVALLKDKDLQKKLVVKGLKQASKFTWDDCAKKTVAVYRSLIGG